MMRKQVSHSKPCHISCTCKWHTRDNKFRCSQFAEWNAKNVPNFMIDARLALTNGCEPNEHIQMCNKWNEIENKNWCVLDILLLRESIRRLVGSTPVYTCNRHTQCLYCGKQSLFSMWHACHGTENAIEILISFNVVFGWLLCALVIRYVRFRRCISSERARNFQQTLSHTYTHTLAASHWIIWNAKQSHGEPDNGVGVRRR